MNKITGKEVGLKLLRMGKKGFMPNYQDNRLLQQAGQLILELLGKVDELTEKCYQLEESLAIREEMDHEGDPEIDEFPPDDSYMDAAAPGEAAEDFWGDDWPLEP